MQRAQAVLPVCYRRSLRSDSAPPSVDAGNLDGGSTSNSGRWEDGAIQRGEINVPESKTAAGAGRVIQLSRRASAYPSMWLELVRYVITAVRINLAHFADVALARVVGFLPFLHPVAPNVFVLARGRALLLLADSILRFLLC